MPNICHESAMNIGEIAYSFILLSLLFITPNYSINNYS